MSRIYRTTDRIKVTIDDVEFKIAPLTLGQKKEIQSYLYKSVSEKDLLAAQDAAILAIKYAVKGVKGLLDSNNEEYQIKSEDNKLHDDCIDELLNIKMSDKLAAVCTSLVHGINTEIIDHSTGKKIEGISFEESDTEKKN